MRTDVVEKSLREVASKRERERERESEIERERERARERERERERERDPPEMKTQEHGRVPLCTRDAQGHESAQAHERIGPCRCALKYFEHDDG